MKKLRNFVWGGVFKKKKFLILILLTLIIFIGSSYALWITNLKQTSTNKVSSSCFSLSIVSEANEIQLNNAIPLTNEEGMRLEPFKITIKNTCDVFASFTVNLEVLEGSTLQSKYLKGQVNREEPANLASLESTDTTIANSIESRILARGSLGSDDEEDYTVRLWMDESVTLADTDAINKTFKSKIVITGQPSTYSPVEQGITKLSEAMLANEYQTSVEVAKQKITAKNNPDFSKTAPLIEWQEVHKTEQERIIAEVVHPSLNGNAALGGQNLTSEDQKIILGKSYTFNKESGMYELTDRIRVDPSTISDFNQTDYYFYNSGVLISSDGTIQSWNDITNCPTIYKINEYVETTEGGTPGTNTYQLQHILKGTPLQQMELESDKSDKGLYQAIDDLGTSYYYRGNVKNNFVKFAGYYWRIIRRNGDGTVRVIYNGPNTNQTGESTSIKASPFNIEMENPAYAGYMYGQTLNTSYNQTHANEVESTAKKELDAWYKTNLLEKGYHSYIADTIFCNDRSVTSGTGVTTSPTTMYGGCQRLNNSKNPILTCPQANDKFTVSNPSGNKALTYPIGLITADELSMAGGYFYEKINKLFYLYNNDTYFTMTPCNYNSGISSQNMITLDYTGRFYVQRGYTYRKLRPVINLKENVEITGGIGTSNDPFIIKTL